MGDDYDFDLSQSASPGKLDKHLEKIIDR